MSPDELRAKQRNGMEMQALAHTAGLFDVFDKVRVAYLETIVDTNPTDQAGRDALYYRIKALDDIRKVMTDVITEGNNARAMIDALTKKQEKQSNVA